jgi:hypothetical protein
MGRTFKHTGSAQQFAWYALHEDDRFVCRCGWSGTFIETARDTHRELVDGSCPRCDTMLVIRSFPTSTAIRAPEM